MANTRLIEEYIRDSGYKLRHVARALNISESALHSKLQGQTQFKLNEAENLSAMLGTFPRIRGGDPVCVCVCVCVSFPRIRGGDPDEQSK